VNGRGASSESLQLRCVSKHAASILGGTVSYQARRGKHPDDGRLFSAEAIEKLKLAAEEMAWLTGRDYAPAVVNDLVGAHHALDARQKIALLRGTCSEPQYRRRAARELEIEDVAKRPLSVDALDVIVIAETALAGGLLLQTLDGTVRAVEGAPDRYEATAETARAIELVVDVLKEARPAPLKLFFDERVGDIARLRDAMLEQAKAKKLKLEAAMTPGAASALRKEKCVASSDSDVLDRCASWFNLSGRAIERVPAAWIVKLQ
jgi:hypothetical protein